MHSICYFIFEEERYLREFLDKYKEFKIYDRDNADQNNDSGLKNQAHKINDRSKV